MALQLFQTQQQVLYIWLVKNQTRQHTCLTFSNVYVQYNWYHKGV